MPWIAQPRVFGATQGIDADSERSLLGVQPADLDPPGSRCGRGGQCLKCLR